MQRRDFFKTACAAGLCSCSVAALLAGDEPVAAPAQTSAPPEDWRIGFGKQRFSKLVSLVAEKVDAKTFNEIIEGVGAYCSGQGFADQFVGNIDGYLAEVHRRWGSRTEHDAEHGIVRISFENGGDCGCPLMAKGLVPAAACRCSVGSVRRNLAVVSQRAAECELKESALEGAPRCSFEVRLGAPV